jgi:hypothetical protein
MVDHLLYFLSTSPEVTALTLTRHDSSYVLFYNISGLALPLISSIKSGVGYKRYIL